MDILAIFVSMSWFGFEFWFWIFWIYAWICAIVLLILCLCLNLGLCSWACFYVPWMELVLDLGWFCWMRGDLWVCVLVFWSIWCLYCEYVVFDFEFSGCVCVVSMLCLILNFWVCIWFRFSWGKKTHKFFFKKNLWLGFWNTAIGGFSRVFKTQPKVYL